MAIDRFNVGRIAERIAANELENRGWRVSDLNRDGTSANADLIAAREGSIWQIQVKGATNTPKDKRWLVQYGHCTEAIINGQEPVFNRKKSFYRAEFVILVAVRSPTEYMCVVLPEKEAESAAQLNLERGYRTPTLKGEAKKPGKIWVHLDPPKKPNRLPFKQNLLEKEQATLRRHRDKWDCL